ncbi:hypothetical protein GGU11DRAFT_757891 [Lentinula aff. detonsa]|nr:hypothetical protein GGU11DRAFT_757891 [Lentinula aff. detonsa]
MWHRYPWGSQRTWTIRIKKAIYKTKGAARITIHWDPDKAVLAVETRRLIILQRQLQSRIAWSQAKEYAPWGKLSWDVSRVEWQWYYIPSTQRTLDPFLGTIAFKRTLSRQKFKSLVENYPLIFKCLEFKCYLITFGRILLQYGAFSRAERNTRAYAMPTFQIHQDNANLPSTASQLSMGNPVPARVLLSTRVMSLLWLPRTMSLGAFSVVMPLKHSVRMKYTSSDKLRLKKITFFCGKAMTVCAGSVVLVCVVSIVTRLAEVLFVHDKSPHQTEGVTATIVRASPDENILPVFEIIERQKECTWYRRPLQRVRVEMITSPSDPLRQLVIVYRWGVDRPFRLGPTNAMAYEVSGISYFGNNALFFPL